MTLPKFLVELTTGKYKCSGPPTDIPKSAFEQHYEEITYAEFKVQEALGIMILPEDCFVLHAYIRKW